MIFCSLGISRDKWHKRRATGGKRTPFRKKKKFELGRPPANTKVVFTLLNSCESMSSLCVQIGGKRIHVVRVRGGNKKYRALRLDTGNYSWGSEGNRPDIRRPVPITTGTRYASRCFEEIAYSGCRVQCQ